MLLTEAPGSLCSIGPTGCMRAIITLHAAGSYSRTVIDGGEGELALEWWQVAGAGVFTVVALGYLAKVAKDALDEAEVDM